MAVPGLDDEERRYLRDVQDHALRVQEQADGFRELLQNILNVNLTLETKALTEGLEPRTSEVKKISAWAAILFAPTLIGTIYGMNFEHMPELHWRLGYPLAIALMIAICLGAIFDLQAPRLDLSDPDSLPRSGRRRTPDGVGPEAGGRRSSVPATSASACSRLRPASRASSISATMRPALVARPVRGCQIKSVGPAGAVDAPTRRRR